MLHDYRLACPNATLLIDATAATCEACSGGRFYQATRIACKKRSRLASLMASVEAYVHRWLGVRSMVDRFVAPSRFLLEKLVTMGAIESSRITHLPYPVQVPQEFAPGGGYLLFAGRVTAIKGVEFLFDAIEQAPEVRLVVAGPADPALKLRLQSLPPNIEYVGVRSGPDVARLMAGASAVAVPSLWYENQPYSILEAFAAGRPVVTSRLGGMAELVGDDERGLLVEPGNAAQLRDAARRLLSDAALARALGEKARAYVGREHTPKVHYDRLLAIFRHVIDGSENKDQPIPEQCGEMT
jgi:glycosyltransferase involved in cell wall biosynthesis